MGLEGVRVEDVEVIELVRVGVVMVAVRSSAVGLLLYVDVVSMELDMLDGEEEIEDSAGVDGSVGDGGREPKEVVREL